MEDGMKVYAIGPNKTDSEEAKFSDILPAQKTDFFGKLSEVTSHRKSGLSEYVEFKGNFTHLTLVAGCPLITKDQVVVGMITDGTMGKGSAVDIKTIESVLDKANIEYIVVSANAPINPPDTEVLEKLLNDVSTIDRSGYTKESLELLDEQVKASKALLEERSVSSNRVEKQYEALSQAYAGLRKVDHKAFYIKIALIVVVLIILVVVALFVRRFIHNMGKDEFEIEDEKLEKKAEKERKKQEKKAKHHEEKEEEKTNYVNTNYDNHIPENDTGEDKTGVLDGQTGVLHENTTKAWLVHESGNRITVNKNRFIVGKAQGVDYRINNNTVSRNHCRILMRGDEFYVEDLGSTNGTFIDGEQLSENVPTKITNGQKLTLSDENFTFEVSGGS
jgi:Na+-transporting methylmalonyl-CoA/oxaloacetate decarboxylase gamma subunit